MEIDEAWGGRAGERATGAMKVKIAQYKNQRILS